MSHKIHYLAGAVVVAAAVCASMPVFAEGGSGSADKGGMAGTMKHGSGMKMPGDELSPELRKHLAEMYRKMGVCLGTTDKSMQACQKEVMKDCPAAAALGYCPLMEGMRATKHGKQGGMNHPMMDHSKM